MDSSNEQPRKNTTRKVTNMAKLPEPRPWSEIQAQHGQEEAETHMEWGRTIWLGERLMSAEHGVYVDVGEGWVEVGELFRAMHDSASGGETDVE